MFDNDNFDDNRNCRNNRQNNRQINDNHKPKKMKECILPIEKFDGNPENLADWLLTYDMDATALDWNEEDMRKRFSLHLTGFARKAYAQLDEDERDTWEHLVDNFRKTLSLRDNVQTNTKNFCTRVQRPDERVAEFAFTLKTLAARAFPNAEEEVIEQLLYNQFITGLRQEIRSHAILVEITKFDEAVQKARIIEENNLFNRSVKALTIRNDKNKCIAFEERNVDEDNFDNDDNVQSNDDVRTSKVNNFPAVDNRVKFDNRGRSPQRNVDRGRSPQRNFNNDYYRNFKGPSPGQMGRDDEFRNFNGPSPGQRGRDVDFEGYRGPSPGQRGRDDEFKSRNYLGPSPDQRGRDEDFNTRNSFNGPSLDHRCRDVDFNRFRSPSPGQRGRDFDFRRQSPGQMAKNYHREHR